MLIRCDGGLLGGYADVYLVNLDAGWARRTCMLPCELRLAPVHAIVYRRSFGLLSPCDPCRNTVNPVTAARLERDLDARPLLDGRNNRAPHSEIILGERRGIAAPLIYDAVDVG